MAGLPPKPTYGTSGFTAGQRLTVTGVATSFANTFNTTSTLIVAQVQTSGVIATFDTQTPTSSYGFTLQPGNYYWNLQTAKNAKFIQVSSASTSFIMVHEFQAITDSDTLPVGTIITAQ